MRSRSCVRYSPLVSRALAASAALAFVSFGAVASANGRMPGANQLVFAPRDPSLAVLRTTFGILRSHDDGGTWDWICEGAIPNLRNGVDPAIALTSSNALVAAVFPGVDVSSDTGCVWSGDMCPFHNLSILDVAVRPDSPNAVVAVGSTPFARIQSDGGSTCPGVPTSGDDGGVFLNQVFQSVDDGAHWSAIGSPLDAAAIVTTVDVAAADPHRIYVSAFRDVDDDAGSTRRIASLYVSTDDGAHWTERPAPLDAANEATIYIAAVDPTNAERVYLRTAGNPRSPSRLLITNDAGKTFQSALSLSGQMLGFALSSDATKIYAGSVEDGLFAADGATLAFHKQSSIPIACLTARGHEIWACSDEKSGFLLGASSDDGVTFTPKLHLCGIHAPIACAPGSGGACTSDALAQLDVALGCGADAGADAATTASTDDAGASAPPASSPPKSSCDCSTIGHHDSAELLAAGALVAIVACIRRELRRRNPGSNSQL